MANKTYAEKLRHPKWQKKRLQVLEKFNFKCLMCEDEETELHVHHKSYLPDTEPWEYPIDNFEVLCKNCHFIVEQEKTTDTEIIKIDRKLSLQGINFYYALAYCEVDDFYSVYIYNNADGQVNFLSGSPAVSLNNILLHIKKHKHGKNKNHKAGIF